MPLKRYRKWDQKDNIGFLILHQYRRWWIDISKLLSIYTYYLRHIHFALVLVWALGSSTFSRYICNTPGVLRSIRILDTCVGCKFSFNHVFIRDLTDPHENISKRPEKTKDVLSFSSFLAKWLLPSALSPHCVGDAESALKPSLSIRFSGDFMVALSRNNYFHLPLSICLSEFRTLCYLRFL